MSVFTVLNPATEEPVTTVTMASAQEAVEQALDAWLADRALSNVSDEALEKLWRDGIASGDAGVLDLAALKKQARGGAA